MKLGSHVSIRGGYCAAAREALSLGGGAFQYFPKNPRSLSVKAYDERDADNCKRFCREHGLLSVAHAPYPTNLSSEEPGLRQATIQSVINDLAIADACGSIGLVVHFGKYGGRDPLQGYKLMIDMLNKVLMDWKGDALLLIENNAGQGAKMGIALEELVQIRGLTDFPDRIGYCLDTCHAFASGLWSGHDWAAVMEKGIGLGYFESLRAVHLNDSAHPGRSYRDRHANIGKGYIGEDNMRNFLRSPVIRELPVILETPSAPGYSHREEIRYVGALAASNDERPPT
ncbi:deoxyribonuclease IV [Paenibacillus arenilitoris]|uniref:Probable endonuclease 4 n=1 Tax=Paenibacillus arenilitoris TaxID=2772299 RepID=A0A927H3X4_9BACL|nr:deoxyribonuclease IV [Paenibacillus arenilitoris]MBD2867811.1 deoxyribonuclease IV [Paenibacillus arenilitoris]